MLRAPAEHREEHRGQDANHGDDEDELENGEAATGHGYFCHGSGGGIRPRARHLLLRGRQLPVGRVEGQQVGREARPERGGRVPLRMRVEEQNVPPAQVPDVPIESDDLGGKPIARQASPIDVAGVLDGNGHRTVGRPGRRGLLGVIRAAEDGDVPDLRQKGRPVVILRREVVLPVYGVHLEGGAQLGDARQALHLAGPLAPREKTGKSMAARTEMMSSTSSRLYQGETLPGIADCGLRIADCRGIADCGLRVADCRGSAACGLVSRRLIGDWGLGVGDRGTADEGRIALASRRKCLTEVPAIG